MNQPALFTNPRQSVIDATLDKADEYFKQKYLELLMEFVRSGRSFIGEDVQREYLKRGLPEPREWRGTGAMYQRLTRKGVMRVVGYRKRNQGNPTPLYQGL